MEQEKEEFAPEQLDKIAKKFNQANDEKQEGWDLLFNDMGIRVHRKFKIGTTYKYRTFGCIPSHPTAYFNFYRDLDHWKTWDENVEELSILEKHNEFSDTVYWAVKYPYPFSSREYIYKRFTKYYESHKMWVICCKACEHAGKPTSKRVRVTQYKMLQALRETPDGTCQTVMESFDDPQLSIPGWLITWVTRTAIPTFMQKLHVECKAYTAKKENL